MKNNNEYLIFEFLGVCNYTYKKYVKINGFDSIVNGLFEVNFNIEVKGLDSNSSFLEIQDVAEKILVDKYAKRLKNCDYKIECTFSYTVKNNNLISNKWTDYHVVIDSLNNIEFNKL